MTTTNNPLPTVNTYLRRNLIDEEVRDSILELMAAYRETQRLEAAVARLVEHCLALGHDLHHGLGDPSLVDPLLYTEFAKAPYIATGLVEPYTRGGRVPF